MPALAALGVADWRRLNRLLEAALLLEGEARTAWLRELPESEADLVPLLRQLLSPKDLTETAQFAAPLPQRADETSAAAEHSGQRIGPYRLLRELGQGGMGTVWLAERADGAFERQVALKLPRAEWTDRGLAQRFARERAVLASLNHPNIAQLYEAGWSDSGRPYLALEYVAGQPIQEWCHQQHLDLRSRLTLFVDVIRAVAHAHARLVVHRDLKPSNVLVTAEGQVKLLDFGIAKLLTGESTAAEETELTRLAGRPLTPNYAAPEQILGQSISTTADIYALGVLLFELLTGERPYRLGRDARRAALEEAIVHVDPPAPSTVAKDKSVGRGLRGDLDAIVLKALKKAPEQRYETAAAFADDIERYLNRLPVRAQRASRTYRVRRFLARNRLAVGAVGGVIVALAVGLSVALWQATVARDEARRATTIKDFVLSIIQQADPVASRQTREADIALLATAESRVDKELESQPEVALQMRRAIGAAYRNRGEFKRATAVLRKGIEQARTTLPPDNLELLGAFVQIAEEYVIDSRKAWADLDAAIQILRKRGPEVQLLLADALLARHRAVRWSVPGLQLGENALEAYRAARATGDAGRILESASEVVETLEFFPERVQECLQVITEAREYATRSGRVEPADPRWIVAMAYHGLALSRAGQETEGLKLSKEAVAAARALHGSDSRVTEVTLGVLAFTLRRRGDDRGALEPMQEAYAISSRRDPPGSANRTLRMNFLVESLFALELQDQVEPLLRENPLMPLVPGSPAASPTGTPIQSRAWESSVRLRLGDTEAAERLAEEAVPHIEAEGGQIVAGRLFATLAQALLQNGKLERAESFAIASIEQEGKEEFIPTAGRRAWKFLLLGEIRLALANYQSALELAEQALSQYSEKLTPSAGRLASVNLLRGRALLGLGRHDEATRALSAVHAHWQKAEPGGLWAARAGYWYGQALIANGDEAEGRSHVSAVSSKLAASRLPRDRALASETALAAQQR